MMWTIDGLEALSKLGAAVSASCSSIIIIYLHGASVTQCGPTATAALSNQCLSKSAVGRRTLAAADLLSGVPRTNERVHERVGTGPNPPPRAGAWHARAAARASARRVATERACVVARVL